MKVQYLSSLLFDLFETLQAVRTWQRNFVSFQILLLWQPESKLLSITEKTKGLLFKGQLQRFHKLISNDRIWPSEHGFKVIFEKSLFVFEISAFKVRNKRGIHSQFHSFSENNNQKTFLCDVTSNQSSMIRAQ